MPPLQTARADEFIALLEERLPEKTLAHSIAVADYMLSFAQQARITPDQAITAALLHDLCKPMKQKELFAAAGQYGITITELHRQAPKLLHGPVAAEECRRSLGIGDAHVYEAIYWHTTGRPDWNPVGLALYVADFSAPTRTMPEAAQTRDILKKDGLEQALRFVVRHKLGYVKKRFTLDPMSEAFEQWVERLPA